MNEDSEPLDKKLEARFMSLNFRLSNLENMHKDFGHRFDAMEDELQEIWVSLDQLKAILKSR